MSKICNASIVVRGIIHHTQSCVLAPDSNIQEHALDKHFLPHDIQTTAVPFPSTPDQPLLLSPLNTLPPSVPCQAIGASVIRNTCGAPKGFSACIETNMRKVVRCKHSPETQRETLTDMSSALTHTVEGRGIKTAIDAQLKQQRLFPGKTSGTRYW